jgi:hypothetical protein
VLDTLELEIGFEEFERTQLWSPSLEEPIWDGVDSWLGLEGLEVLE